MLLHRNDLSTLSIFQKKFSHKMDAMICHLRFTRLPPASSQGQIGPQACAGKLVTHRSTEAPSYTDILQQEGVQYSNSGRGSYIYGIYLKRVLLKSLFGLFSL